MITLQQIKSLFPCIEDMEQETWHTKAYKVSIDEDAIDTINGYSELDLYLYRENDKDTEKEIGLCLDDGTEQIAWCWANIEDLNKNETVDFLQYCTVLKETEYTF
jgi:hypothetical protein